MKTIVINIRIPEDMDPEIEAAAKKLVRSKADTIRDAIRLGLVELALLKGSDYDRMKEEIRAAKLALADKPDPPQPLKSVPRPVTAKKARGSES